MPEFIRRRSFTAGSMVLFTKAAICSSVALALRHRATYSFCMVSRDS